MNSATYCPEDNKLRLYVGRVPREDYERLRAMGWTSTPKQSCDFVAVWTPERRDLCLEWCGTIEDEDQTPEERAAARAERFAGYRDKRTDEALDRADRYDAGPSAHGFQSQARAERAAARHDRVAARACDAWSKAEYWTRRTAGVISHALHVSSPAVRMGRIKEIESELRGLRARWEGQQISERGQDWINHLELRLAYENQMIEAQGGRLGSCEIEIGGTLGGKVIAKVNRSNATGRTVSVHVVGPAVQRWAYQVTNVPGTPFALYQFGVERMAPDAYRAPTDESRAALAEFEAAKKAAAKARKAATPPCPLINPTDEDAERLQALWDERNRAKGRARLEGSKYAYAPELEGSPSTVLRISQATYSANSGGAYAKAETTDLFPGGVAPRGYARRNHDGTPACKIRVTSGETYKAERVIILTDKPQRPLPAAVWEQVAETVNA